MRFQTKMVLMYSILAILLALILGASYHAYSVKQYKKTEYHNMEISVRQMDRQFNAEMQSMEFMMEYLLSDMDVLDGLLSLAVVDNDMAIRREALDTINSKLVNYYIMNNFYRIIIFNEAGDVIASNDYAPMVINKNFDPSEITWLTQVKNRYGKPLLIGVHTDEWGLRYQKPVFSLVKEIQGMSMGFIEVELLEDRLAGIFALPKEGMNVIAFKEGEEVLYSTYPEACYDFYRRTAADAKEGIQEITNPLTNEKEAVVVHTSEDYGVTILLSESEKIMASEYAYILPITISVIGVFLLISLFFNFFASRFLTRPIRDLKAQMEQTNLSNLNDKIQIGGSNDEIIALGASYQQMLGRLNEMIQKEQKLSLLQLEAQYDLLQAQVNPHFIYNVLNVISGRGVMDNDETICEICRSLASMLRYSTDTRTKSATVREESEYLETYFYLMKSRYDYKLNYTIKIDDKIMDQKIPKVSLQQIAENSVIHGFRDAVGGMELSVYGWCEGEFWYIAIQDNGTGFEEPVLDKLNQDMETIREKLLKKDKNMKTGIGGMGLINTYARLLLTYGEDTVFRISSSAVGTKVIIGSRMKEEVSDVSDFGSR